jgi:hypothetical protein
LETLDFNGEYINDNVIIDKAHKNIYSLNTRTEKDKFPISQNLISDYNFWALVLEATEKTQKPFLKRALESTFLEEQLINNDDLLDFIKSSIYKIIDKEDDNLNIAIIIDFLSHLGDCLTNSNIWETLSQIRQNLHYNSTTNGFYIEPNNYNKTEVLRYLEDLLSTITFDEIQNDSLLKVRLRIILQFHHEIINGFSNIEHLSPLLKRTPPRINDLRKVIVISNEIPSLNISIVSLRDVNIQMRKMLPLLICKQLYEKKKEENVKEKYLNIIIDEAHNILSTTSQRESETWKDYRLETFEEIIKEGRKFGTFLTIASQRPSDISATIISQLHNFFLHRLINNNDIKAVERTVSYLDKLSFESLPIIPTGTCILAGLSAQVPVMIDIGKITKESEPDNKTMSLIDNWKDE